MHCSICDRDLRRCICPDFETRMAELRTCTFLDPNMLDAIAAEYLRAKQEIDADRDASMGKMNPTLQRLALAKLEGWEPCEPRVFVRHAPSHAFMKDEAYYGGLNAIPNYLEDRNAMHSLKRSLTYDQRVQVTRELYSILDRDLSSGEVEWPDVVSDQVEIATTLMDAELPQLSEAILKSLKLWQP